MFEPYQRIRPNVAKVAAKVLDGEAIIINLVDGTYYSMAGVGGQVWELIERGMSISELAERLARAYGVDVARVTADLTSLVRQLGDEDLVCAAPEGGDGAATDDPLNTEEPYQAPVLNIFRDMKDLLALDPPMPGLRDVPWK